MNSTAELPIEATVAITVIRADGRVEEFGVVDAFYDDPWKQFKWQHFGKPLADFRIRRANARQERQ